MRRETPASVADDEDLADLPPDVCRAVRWFIADLASTIQGELLFVAEHGRNATVEDVFTGRLNDADGRELLSKQLAAESPEPDLRIVRI